MDRTYNTRTDLEALKNQYTKSLNEIDLELRINGNLIKSNFELSDFSGHLTYEIDEETKSDESSIPVIDDEKLKKDLLDEKDHIKESRLNPETETEFKEPDPDEKILIIDNENGKIKHPL